MDNVPKKPLETVAQVRDEKDDRLLLACLTARDNNRHGDQAVNRKTLLIRVKFHADSNSVKIRRVNSGTLPCV